MFSPAILIALAACVGYALLDNFGRETSRANSDFLRNNLAG